MKLEKSSPRRAASSVHVRHYSFHVAPRSWFGRAVAAVVGIVVVALAFFFFSMFVAVGALLLLLAIAAAILRSSFGGGGAKRQDAPDGVIDMERSPDDGVYRKRD